MKHKIKNHLDIHLKTLGQLLECLEHESRVLSKATSEEVFAIIHKKQQIIRELNQLELERVNLLNKETLEDLIQKYPDDQQLKDYQRSFQDCCQKISTLATENEELTKVAHQVAQERMAFYRKVVNESRGTQSTYARGGAYTKVSAIGSTILERTI